MTLERHTDAGGTVVVRLVECPFCAEPIGPDTGRDRTRYSGAAAHLRRCEAFYEAMGVDPEDPLPLTSTRSAAPAEPPPSMTECTDCGTTFDPERDTVGSSTRCPSCGTDHPDATREPRSNGGAETAHLEIPAGTTVRITIEVLPSQ